VPSNAISWWPANNYLNDIVGTNNVAVVFMPVPSLYATGKVGQAFNHDGFGSRLQVVSSASLNFGSNADFSIEGWIKAISPLLPPIFQGATNPLVPLIEKRAAPGSSGVGYSFLMNQGRLAFSLSSSTGTNSSFVSSGPDLRDAMFHHVAVTVRRADTNGGKLYLDGQELLTFTPTSQRGSLSNSSPLFIGSPTTTLSNSIFTGLIDEMTMYARALSASEILSIRQAGAAGKCLPPPTILGQPTNVLVNAGGSAIFRVLASGVPTLTYQWHKNGTNILSATSSILSLSGVSVGDSGAYDVAVSSPAGSTKSAGATLTVNRPPLASNLAAGTTVNTPLTILNDKLVMSAPDPDGDPVSLTSVSATSTNRGSVTRGADSVTYTPVTNFVGSDQFTWTVSDGRGGSASAFVLIQVRAGDAGSANMFPPTPVDGGFTVSFAGIPGRAYTLQRADNPGGPWSNLASVTAGPDGIGTYTDTNAPPTSAYYRTTYP
jgi:hypothetical protein